MMLSMSSFGAPFDASPWPSSSFFVSFGASFDVLSLTEFLRNAKSCSKYRSGDCDGRFGSKEVEMREEIS